MSAFELGKFGVKFGPAKKLLNAIENDKKKKRDTEHLLIEDEEEEGSTKGNEVQDSQEGQGMGGSSILSEMPGIVFNNEEFEKAQTEDQGMESLSDLSAVLFNNEE